jgi:hypothetical protein
MPDMQETAKMKQSPTPNLGGRPRTLRQPRRKCYSLEADQEQFLADMAKARNTTESHVVRQIIEGVRQMCGNSITIKGRAE